MDTQIIHATISLMKNNKTLYSIKIDNIDSYVFSFDNKNLAVLSITVSNLSINDLNMLIDQSYDGYVLMATKKIFKNGTEQTFSIPAKLYRRMSLVDNGREIIFTFKELNDD